MTEADENAKYQAELEIKLEEFKGLLTQMYWSADGLASQLVDGDLQPEDPEFLKSIDLVIQKLEKVKVRYEGY